MNRGRRSETLRWFESISHSLNQSINCFNMITQWKDARDCGLAMFAAWKAADVVGRWNEFAKLGAWKTPDARLAWMLSSCSLIFADDWSTFCRRYFILLRRLRFERVVDDEDKREAAGDTYLVRLGDRRWRSWLVLRLFDLWRSCNRSASTGFDDEFESLSGLNGGVNIPFVAVCFDWIFSL